MDLVEGTDMKCGGIYKIHSTGLLGSCFSNVPLITLTDYYFKLMIASHTCDLTLSRGLLGEWKKPLDHTKVSIKNER